MKSIDHPNNIPRLINWEFPDHTAVGMHIRTGNIHEFWWDFLLVDPPPDNNSTGRKFRWLLLWNRTKEWKNANSISFDHLIEIREFIIRIMYGISGDELIPSRLLLAAHLAYESGEWLDLWGEKNLGEVIVPMTGNSWPEMEDKRIDFLPGGPPQRGGSIFNIGGPAIIPHRVGQAIGLGITGCRPPRYNWDIDKHVNKVTIPIVPAVCFSEFRKGGHFDKSEKLEKSSCQEDKKAV